MLTVSPTQSRDLRLLTSTFILVKSIIFVIPQLVLQQYDTSSQLLFVSPKVPEIVNYVLPRFLVWDTVFFIHIAQRGYVYEQEWAFGWLWTGAIRYVGNWIVAPIIALLWNETSSVDEVGQPVGSLYAYAIAAILIAHACHYLAVITLYAVSTKIEKDLRALETEASSGRSVSGANFPLVAALLYIISPGGVFMSAGYAETLFAFFGFLGIFLREINQHILAGLSFAITCGLRGNGVLWGIIFLNDLYEAVQLKRWKKSVGVIIGGSLIGIGFLSGQVYAYYRYCPGRPWCDNAIPSIFGFVQSHYWNNGFLKYWRTWQIPNFLFAFPTWFLFWRSFLRYRNVPRFRPYVIIQMLMFVMSLLFWHVQIITRVGTCMPLVYWHVAQRIYADEPLDDASENIRYPLTIKGIIRRGKADFKKHEGAWAVRYMLTWILVQAVLFASFLPPA
ncbi:uncharacterized protein V1518DRAFT_195942 [Limtongia smithiae]|uniref:uncharacterized protein n=1 Tax=Limtongia smithiae TaxID=1125753 RepID=UPI0034CF2065